MNQKILKSIGWPRVMLGDQKIATMGSGGTPSRQNAEYFKGKILWVKSGELKEAMITDTEEKISTVALNNSSAKIFPRNTVLIAMYGATVGRTAILGADAATNQAVCGIITNPKMLLPEYLFYYLQSKKNFLIGKSIGGAQPNISQTVIRHLEVPLPPIEAQKHIASILERAEQLKEKRKKANELLAKLPQSVFLEMFGNLNNFEQTKCEELCENISVGIVIKPSKYYRENGVPALRSLNIKPNKFNLENLVFVSEADNNSKIIKSRLNKGDIVMVRTGYPGTSAVVDDNLAGANCIDLIILRPKKELVNPYFLANYLNSDFYKAKIAANKRGIAQQHFNIGSVKKSLIPLIKISAQNEFVEQVRKVEILIEHQKSCERELSFLFESLLQKAFNGKMGA